MADLLDRPQAPATKRLVQAVGSGVFIPMMMNVVMAVAPREKLGTYFSVGSSCIVLGPAFGPVISGIMVTAGGWRAVFAPGCAVFAVLAVVGAFGVHNLGEPGKPRLDAFSVASMVAGLVCVSYGLTKITYDLLIALNALAVGGVAIALFVRRQKRLDEPLLDVRPLARSGFSLACCLVVIAMMTTFSLSVLLPLYFETALGLSAFASGTFVLWDLRGLAFVAFLIGFMIRLPFIVSYKIKSTRFAYDGKGENQVRRRGQRGHPDAGHPAVDGTPWSV